MIQRIRDNGDAAPRYDYDAFGNQQTVNTDPNPFRYCGEYWDDETNLIYLRARYYDSKTGRFISQDSVHSTTNSMPNETEATDPLSLNLYNYCYNNPTRYFDSSGNFPLAVALGAAGVLLWLALAGEGVNSAARAVSSGADPIRDIQQLVENAAQAVQTVYMLPTYIVACTFFIIWML